MISKIKKLMQVLYKRKGENSKSGEAFMGFYPNNIFICMEVKNN